MLVRCSNRHCTIICKHYEPHECFSSCNGYCRNNVEISKSKHQCIKYIDSKDVIFIRGVKCK